MFVSELISSLVSYVVKILTQLFRYLFNQLIILYLSYSINQRFIHFLKHLAVQ